MLEVLGWIATVLVLLGFWFNSRQKHMLAIGLWIVGDISWIIYDIYIANLSHAVLSLVIIFINLYGIKNIIWKNTH